MLTKLTLSCLSLLLCLMAPLAAGAETVLFQDDFKNSIVRFPSGTSKAYPNPDKWAFTFWPGTRWPDSYGDGTNWLAANGDCQTYVTPFITRVNGVSVPAAQRYDPFTVTAQGLEIRARLLNQTQRDVYQVSDCRRYGSGMLLSRFNFTYGKIRIVAKMPSARGSWPAAWLLPETHEWPPEIDIFEIMAWGNQSKQLSSGLLGAQSDGATAAAGWAQWFNIGVNPSEGFHEYGLDWNASTISMSFNGRTLWTRPTPASMKKNMYLIINFGVGGRWPYNLLGIQPIDGMSPARLRAGSSLIQGDYPDIMVIKSVKITRN